MFGLSPFKIVVICVAIILFLFTTIGWVVVENDRYGFHVCRNHPTEKLRGEKFLKFLTPVSIIVIFYAVSIFLD